MAIVSNEQVIRKLSVTAGKIFIWLRWGHETVTPILRVPAIVFLYLLGKTEAEGQNGK